jgi:hypothetical protein
VIYNIYKEDKQRREEEPKLKKNIKGFIRLLKLVLIRIRDLYLRTKFKY